MRFTELNVGDKFVFDYIIADGMTECLYDDDLVYKVEVKIVNGI